ncbi:class I tRNA ligase family protein [Candidatus Minimicrobia vallesae]|uniref:class I tRNA ligase family protein n=1 Tax=Candidatus Minimicrobia vallesae TaxID=2841264 RepID=UPI001E5BF790|nr:class I tRNA ligase family protein [Candidatus Minimicrobia vallesae]
MQLAKQYIPNDYEPNIYALWETSEALEPTGVGKPYSIIMPPPNANGNLHIGHALDMNLKDNFDSLSPNEGVTTLYLFQAPTTLGLKLGLCMKGN